jgi:hypothetical protein
MVQGCPEQKLVRFPSNNKTGVVVHIINSSYLRRQGRKILVQGWLQAKMRVPIQKMTKARKFKKDWNIASLKW